MLSTSRLAGLQQTLQKNKRFIRKVAMGLATVFLIVGLIYSYNMQPQVLQNLQWRPIIVLAAIGVPLTLWLNAVEFRILARLNRIQMPMVKALEVTVIGSAANMLPLPGSTIVRVAALKAAGSPLVRGTSSTILGGVIWVSVAFGYAGLWMLGLGTGFIAPAFIAIGGLVLIGSVFWWLKLDGSFRLFAWMFATKLLLVFTDSARIYLCFASLGVSASFAQISGLAVAGVLGSAVSIVPAGLGVREGVSAALSPIVGLVSVLGFMAAFINRLVGLSVLAPVASYLSIRKISKV
jgi:uncharacterized membrane protein YbhN (UPF0104 family)